jgi:hypothetical protein
MGLRGVLVPFFGKLICVCASWLPILSAQSVRPSTPKVQLPRVSGFEQKTNSLIKRFSTSGRTLVNSVIDLAFKYQVPMAIEYADREATTRPLNLEFHNKSLRGIVEAIVKEDRQYRVSFSNGIVDIFSPTAREDRSNLLNKVLKDFSVTEMETREADFKLFCALVQAAGSNGCAGSLAAGQWDPIRITLHLQNARAYEILNAIVAQNGSAIWTVTASNLASFPKSSGLWYIYPLQEPFRGGVSDRLVRGPQ